MKYLLVLFFISAVSFVLSVVIAPIILLRLKQRPHRAKIFFSYSHKDTEVAKRIMDVLGRHHFRVWVDFGIEISEEQLETELRRNIKPREIFMILASENSAGSRWVNFELRESSGHHFSKFVPRWRDVLVLALDERGIQMFETVNEAARANAREYYESELKLDERSLSDRLGFETYVSTMFPYVSKWPIFRRIWMPNVACFKLTPEFDLGLSQVAEHLGRHTRLLPRLPPKAVQILLAICLPFFLFWFCIFVTAFFMLLVFFWDRHDF